MGFLPTVEETARGGSVAEQYWAQVKDERNRLREELLGEAKCDCGSVNLRHKPSCPMSRVEDCVFITSRAVPLKGVIPGSVCEATTDIAARRISDLTHRLSTAEEIRDFRAGQRERLQRSRDQDRAIAESQGHIINNAGPTTAGLTPEALRAALTPDMLKSMGYVAAKTGDECVPEVPKMDRTSSTETTEALKMARTGKGGTN